MTVIKKPGGHGSWKEEKVVVDVANSTVTATKDEIDFDDGVANTAAEEVKYKIAANTAHTVPKPGKVKQTRADTTDPIPE